MTAMTVTGTFVLAFPRDPWDALARAEGLSTAALGLLFRYLTRPPLPGVSRADLAAAYGLSIGELRRDNALLAEAGYLMQARRPLGKGAWQHLIVIVDTPGALPAEHEAWTLLDASLAASQAGTSPNTSPQSVDVATCGDATDVQVATCAENPRIEPVNPFSPADQEPKPSVVATVAELKLLAKLPPLPAPKDQGELWLTPAQVITLAAQYPPRYADLALGVLARVNLPFYLAPRVMALMIQGYDTTQLGRTLADVGQGEHPAALARWRLDQLILAPAPNHVAWRAPSTVLPVSRPPADREREAVTARGAALVRADMRARGLRV